MMLLRSSVGEELMWIIVRANQGYIYRCIKLEEAEFVPVTSAIFFARYYCETICLEPCSTIHNIVPYDEPTPLGRAEPDSAVQSSTRCFLMAL